MNQSIHTIDLMLHLVGPVKSVRASCGLEAHQGIEVEDVAVAMVEFANGARGVIQASTACYSNTGLPASIHVCGDKGSIRMCDDKFDLWDLRNPLPRDEEILERFGVGAVEAGAGAADPKAIDFQWHQRNFEDALEALRLGEKPQVDGSEARRIAKGGFEAGGERDALFVTIMLLGLSAVTIGNGFFKPNISTMVGSLYAKGDSRRDAGFTIFYMGINLGSLGSQLACPFLADAYGWWAGFLLAACGMALSWYLIQFAGPKLAGYGEPPAGAPNRDLAIYIGAIAFVPCGHVACCGTCAQQVGACPLCKQGIRQRVPIFLP